MHAVSNAINILDPAKIIDAKICKSVKNSAAEEGKCKGATKPDEGTNNRKWSEWFVDGNTDWANKGHEPWSEHNSKVVSKDTAALSREEKGVVSSVFAKVIEGAVESLGNIDAKICRLRTIRIRHMMLVLVVSVLSTMVRLVVM